MADDSAVTGFNRGLEPEKVLDGWRSNDGQLMLSIKWKGTEETDAVVAEEAYTKCPQAVAQFYEERYRQEKKGFARGLDAETVDCAFKIQGRTMLLMKWKGSDDMDIVTAEEAKAKCPQVCIEFYESIYVQKKMGFARGLEPEKVVNMRRCRNGDVLFTVKWKGTNELDLLPAAVVKAKCPELVIRLYEEILKEALVQVFQARGRTSSSNRARP